ncbi:S41 family peptidase [Streptomyces sp. AV19]|uniref:S41 family peptidase n=1 Tax=Streptomyces sp. AV19 TaxID=2793068 RepID=UPI0018FE8AC3|nr:S41 family peptidase [Streptomyces sp. AV19]MBH1936544.1 S41 family peptidase [Streptomyces sp. AV19]MDG4532603.1 S41 family peptidase [Streptomyces sp. AV19]
MNAPTRRTAIALLTTTLALTTTAVGNSVASPAAPTAAAGLDGLWRSEGYGTVVSIADGGRRLRTWETTAVSCLPGAPDAKGNGSGRFTDAEGSGLTVSPDGTGRLRMAFDEGVGHRVLRRTAALPAGCAEKPRTDPRRVFDVFWQTYAENYPFFAAHGVDWRAVRDRYRPRITARTGDDELFAVLREMIEPLHDGHTSIDAGPGRRFGGHRADTVMPTRESIVRTDKAVAEAVGAPLRSWAQGAVSYADLPDGLGYLRITRFTRFAAKGGPQADAAELDRALDAVFTPSRVRSLRGLVLDLRFNGGGSDRLGIRVAQRLTDRPYVAYLKHARSDPRDPRRFTPEVPVRVEPHAGPAYTGPLAVLTGRLTISAGETFTQALMGRASAPTRIGENTQGSFSDVLERRLPNGWTFGLPNEEFMTADPQRRTYDVTGIPPQVRTPVFTEEEFAGHRDSALAKARRLLTAGRR